MSKQIKMGLTDDAQDSSGNWRKTVCLPGMQWQTISYSRWKGINARCKDGGAYQNRQPSYIGCTNEFKGFQEFVEWSRQQVGYDLEGYQLDKDLLFKGNKIYSPDTCVFLPSRINSLLIKANSIRGDFPVGVSFNSKRQKFIAFCSNGSGSGRQMYLGGYNSPEAAFNVYKSYKESLIKQVAEEYKDVIDIRAYNALKSYQVEITD